MNSLLQCMFHIPLFQKEIFEKPEVACKPISLRLSNLLLQSLSGSDVQRRDVVDLKIYIDEQLPQFKGTRQQDAQEFFQAIKGYIHRELNEASEKARLCTEVKPGDVAGQIDAYVAARTRVHHSMITRLFEGLLLNTITCPCGHERMNVEVFDEFCLHLTDTGESFKISELLSKYFQPEAIEELQCEHCGEKREASKQSVVKYFPKVLVLHVKRFAFAHNEGKKIEAEVEAELSQQVFGETYQLSGLILHKGDLSKGHYFAWCLNPDNGRWYEYNDSQVAER
ncbi:ubiquitin carboxyl-terminal hydrolase 4-like [Hippocampus zosterae]|uniref:ubiquitin carboxyl-terminal hydrolase 4-like n=1 Tax=Hippocampus zosterae TaxID=109293 RepID=UPI00223E466C|nr:ubiquitin carboxyl-terminal hydrolase 4-like [Hippocampus zosterae]